ncbi:MAG: O-methyltransferase [Sandaracinaceae bacterium]|nr:O-methyltransferase [Sandaracinaceae bacterium]
MANRTLPMDDAIHAYLVGVSVRETDAMRRLRAETAALAQARMQIGPEQGAFMGWLVASMGARRCLEIGTFTGYSALWIAGAMGEGGRLVCLDVSEEYGAVARRAWADAGLADRIALHVAPAAETLRALDEPGTWDFAFIDADKPNYDLYYEACLRLLRPGGVIAIDNVLWGGAVADPASTGESTEALRALNAKVAADARVDACMVPIGDGLTLARKR